MSVIELIIIIACFCFGFWIISKLLSILQKPPVDIGSDHKDTKTNNENSKV